MSTSKRRAIAALALLVMPLVIGSATVTVATVEPATTRMPDQQRSPRDGIIIEVPRQGKQTLVEYDPVWLGKSEMLLGKDASERIWNLKV